MNAANDRRLVVIGGGPAGLMAAECAINAGLPVDLHERMGSVGRKFLIAGKGGLNLTHSEPFAAFVQRYGAQRDVVESWLREFPPDQVRSWAGELGVDTFIGSSGRVFPRDLKAAPLLRAWVRRLRANGVRFHVNSRWAGWTDDGALRLIQESGEQRVRADAVVLAVGGGSWPVLGSDGSWAPLLAARDVEVAPLQPSNCGFDVGWSPYLRTRHAGAPIKPVAIAWRTRAGTPQQRQGEFVLTESGIEGSLVYALSADLREEITAHGEVLIHLDLVPGRDTERLRRDLSRPRGSHSMAKHLHRHAGIDGAKSALLHEILPRADFADVNRLVEAIKALPLRLKRARPLAEAISSAGGIRLQGLDESLMLRKLPGVFCAGEMLDWEAPTGGYLLTASMASGRIAGLGAVRWLQNRTGSSP
jgi:uncharacterized flavoprotein (TIGR03862 family)